MSDKPISYVAANRVEGIIIDARTNITAGAFDLIRKFGISVIWKDYRDDGMMLIPFNTHGSVEVRKAQFSAFDDERGLILAAKFAYAASINKQRVLQRIKRYRPQLLSEREPIERINEIIKNLESDQEQYEQLDESVRQVLMNFEAQVAKIYWETIGEILTEYDWEFSKRSRRPADNPFNALLNYGYAVLKGNLTESVAITGLDIYAGYLHTDRSGRESLILDVIEEFRQICVDEVCLRLVMDNQLQPDMFEVGANGVKLDKTVKQIYLQALIANFNQLIRSRKLSKWWVFQARSISNFLRRREPNYQPFIIQVRDTWSNGYD